MQQKRKNMAKKTGRKIFLSNRVGQSSAVSIGAEASFFGQRSLGLFPCYIHTHTESERERERGG